MVILGNLIKHTADKDSTRETDSFIVRLFMLTDMKVESKRRDAIHHCWPLHRCKCPQRSAVWSPRSLCRRSPSPQRPGGPQAPLAGASERTAQRPPAEKEWDYAIRENISHTLFQFKRVKKASLLPLCTKIIQAGVRPWPQPRSPPIGFLPWWPCCLQTKQEEIVLETRLQSDMSLITRNHRVGDKRLSLQTEEKEIIHRT